MITINLNRISADKKYIEFNVETLSNYKFDKLYIWSYKDTNIWNPTVNTVDIGSYYDKINNKEIKRIPISEIFNLDLKGNSMYYLQFTIVWDGTGVENPDAILYQNTVIVDLSLSYFTKARLLNDFNNQNDNMKKINKLVIYEGCLKSAINNYRWTDANYYFDLIVRASNNQSLL